MSSKRIIEVTLFFKQADGSVETLEAEGCSMAEILEKLEKEHCQRKSLDCWYKVTGERVEIKYENSDMTAREAATFGELVEVLEQAKEAFRKENLWHYELHCQQVLARAKAMQEKENG